MDSLRGNMTLRIPDGHGGDYFVSLDWIFFTLITIQMLRNGENISPKIRAIKILRAVPGSPYDLHECKYIYEFVEANEEKLMSLRGIL